jgi:hypothetical protein
MNAVQGYYNLFNARLAPIPSPYGISVVAAVQYFIVQLFSLELVAAFNLHSRSYLGSYFQIN